MRSHSSDEAESLPLGGSLRSTAANELEGLRVLYAEDHPGMQKAVGRLLRTAGASVAIAHDGLEATEMALAEPFDLILMDLRMPRMDGIDAGRVLRAAGCGVPLIAVTADATPVVRANAIAAGFDIVISKPFALSDLVSATELVRARQAAQRGNPGSG